MKINFKVVGIETLPNKLIALTLQNLDVPPDISEIKEPDNMFDIGGMMKSAMVMQQKIMFRQMHERNIYTRLILTPTQFGEIKVTVGDEIVFNAEDLKIERRSLEDSQ